MKKAKLQKELRNKSAIEDCAKEFGILGDETRLKICYLLCKHPELSVGDMAGVLRLSISAVSRSLDKLRRIGVVERRREFRTVFYSIKECQLTNQIKRGLGVSNA